MAESSPNGLENPVGKGEVAHYEDLYCRHIKTRAFLGKGLQHFSFFHNVFKGLLCKGL